MVSPTDELALATGLAGVEATLKAQSERYDRFEHTIATQITKVLDRIDDVYPKVATLEERTRQLESSQQELRNELRQKTAATRSWLQMGVAAILGGGVSYAIADMFLRGH